MRAPASRKACAMARPMPCAAPDSSTTRPSSRISIGDVLFCRAGLDADRVAKLQPPAIGGWPLLPVRIDAERLRGVQAPMRIGQRLAPDRDQIGLPGLEDRLRLR